MKKIRRCQETHKKNKKTENPKLKKEMEKLKLADKI